MTVTIDLEPELEARLRAEAARQGLDPGAFVRSALEERLRRSRVNEPARLPATESELLQKINLGLSQETWHRYHELTGKRGAETLTPAEHAELLALTHVIEEANARRIGHLVELARLRGVSPDRLMLELGISATSPDGHV